MRSPYGQPASVFSSDYVSGGSSSGSYVSVASNQVSFSLATDTAGSGRVPAAFNNIIGFKPTRGTASLHILEEDDSEAYVLFADSRSWCGPLLLESRLHCHRSFQSRRCTHGLEYSFQDRRDGGILQSFSASLGSRSSRHPSTRRGVQVCDPTS